MAIDPFGFDETDDPHAFIQWKGTDVCMDFHCTCSAHGHFDGFFAYFVKCQHCGTIWQMPHNLAVVKVDLSDEQGCVQLLEPDEDYSDEVVGKDGITRLVPRKLSTEAA